MGSRHCPLRACVKKLGLAGLQLHGAPEARVYRYMQSVTDRCTSGRGQILLAVRHGHLEGISGPSSVRYAGIFLCTLASVNWVMVESNFIVGPRPGRLICVQPRVAGDM